MLVPVGLIPIEWFSVFPEKKLARRRVVVTGLGIVSPVGNSIEQAWQNILSGRSGIDRISRFDASTFPVQIAGEVRDFDVAQYIPAKDARRMDTFIHYGMAAGIRQLGTRALRLIRAMPTGLVSQSDRVLVDCR